MKIFCYLCILYVASFITSATKEENKNSFKKRKRSKQVLQTVELCEPEGHGIMQRLAVLSSPTSFDTDVNDFDIFSKLIEHLILLRYLDYASLASYTDITVFAPTDGAFFEFIKSKYDLNTYDEAKVFSLVVEYFTTFGQRGTGGQIEVPQETEDRNEQVGSKGIWRPPSDDDNCPNCPAENFVENFNLCMVDCTKYLEIFCCFSPVYDRIFNECLQECGAFSIMDVNLSENLFKGFIYNHFIQNKINIADLQTTNVDKGLNMLFPLHTESDFKNLNLLKVTRYSEDVEIQSSCADRNSKPSKVMKEYSFCNENIIVIDWPLEFPCYNS